MLAFFVHWFPRGPELDTDLGPECAPLMPLGWTLQLHLNRNPAGKLAGVGVLSRHGEAMCHLTLPGVHGERAQALRAVKLRVEAWLAEWQSRRESPRPATRAR